MRQNKTEWNLPSFTSYLYIYFQLNITTKHMRLSFKILINLFHLLVKICTCMAMLVLEIEFIIDNLSNFSSCNENIPVHVREPWVCYPLICPHVRTHAQTLYAHVFHMEYQAVTSPRPPQRSDGTCPPQLHHGVIITFSLKYNWNCVFLKRKGVRVRQ